MIRSPQKMGEENRFRSKKGRTKKGDRFEFVSSASAPLYLRVESLRIFFSLLHFCPFLCQSRVKRARIGIGTFLNRNWKVGKMEGKFRNEASHAYGKESNARIPNATESEKVQNLCLLPPESAFSKLLLRFMPWCREKQSYSNA